MPVCWGTTANTTEETTAIKISLTLSETLCPELLGGLSTPRQPAEIQNGIVTNVAGESVDTPFRKGAQAALEIAIREKAELAILQPRSPSCGCKQIYDGTFSRRLIKGKGIFAQLLSEHGIPAIEPDEVKHHERR